MGGAMRRLTPILMVVWLLVGLACTPFTAPYSEEGYRLATSTKAEALALIARSNESYASHASKAEDMRLKLDIGYEYAKGRARNEDVTEAWDLMRRDAGLLGAYLTKWQSDGRVNAFTRDEASETIALAFDKIICLESTRRAVTDCNAIGAPPAE